MTHQKLENNVRQGVAKVKKELSTLEGDRIARFGRFETGVSKAAEEFTTWVDDGVSQLGKGIEKLADDAKETVVSSAAAVKQDVDHGFSRYNAKIQGYADKVPGNFSYKVDRYPWVAISIALALGFLLGNVLKPTRRPLGKPPMEEE